MRFTTRSRAYICLPCQMKADKLLFSTSSLQRAVHPQRFRTLVSSPLQRSNAQDFARDPTINTRRCISQLANASEGPTETGTSQIDQKRRTAPHFPTRSRNPAPSVRYVTTEGSGAPARNFGTVSSPPVELSEAQQKLLKTTHDLTVRLSQGMSQVSEAKKDPSTTYGIPIETVLQTLPSEGYSTEQRTLAKRIGSVYSGKSFGTVKDELNLAVSYRDRSRRKVTDPAAVAVLVRLGVIDKAEQTTQQYTPLSAGSNAGSGGYRRQSLGGMVSSSTAVKPSASKAANKSQSKKFPAAVARAETKSVASRDLALTPVEVESTTKVPELCHDLQRVLFNPGIYQLRDPRSRVYNFDPYLEKIMPVSEFNFEALSPYLTSSEDHQLIKIAKAHQKRYIGSSSSMTGILSQFHFLISHWRELNIRKFSRGFEESSSSVTNINKSPAAIFLRYRDGVYAVDADKEFDEPNILLSLGKSMEKLFTLNKDEYEKWRRSNTADNAELLGNQPDAFHYSQQGRFLFRSQLDACDPRLPGTGVFDLKTRAVAGIRMNLRDYETGMGYQIKEQFGTWESYEREYYDMMRSTFLKYSLQARMGSMDGIFVAYHNISRIFGFQYISLEEMDLALHGQSNTCLGDQEFRFSINFLEEIFNVATERYPQSSLRIHFETREGSGSDSKPYMNIFIEAMREDDISAIQNSQKAQFEIFERKLFDGEDADSTPASEAEVATAAGESMPEKSTSAPEETADDAALPVNNIMPRPAGPASSAADKDFLDNILNSPKMRARPEMTGKEVMGLRLTVQNKINDKPVPRPIGIEPAARWAIDYQLETRSDEEARRLYTVCKSKRVSTVKQIFQNTDDNWFLGALRNMSQRGAEWRKQQDELDADRAPIVLYGEGSEKKT